MSWNIEKNVKQLSQEKAFYSWGDVNLDAHHKNGKARYLFQYIAFA